MDNFTTAERRALSRTKTPVRDTMPDWLINLIIILAAGFVLAYTADAFGLTNIAHAQTTATYHDNAYYCTFLKAGEATNATQAQIKKVCPNNM